MAIPAHRKPASTFFPSDPAEPDPASQDRDDPRPRPARPSLRRVAQPLARYIDVVEDRVGAPAPAPPRTGPKRIRFYHDLGVEVSTGGTLLEYAVARDRASAAISEAKELGFDIVEVSDGVIEMAASPDRQARRGGQVPSARRVHRGREEESPEPALPPGDPRPDRSGPGPQPRGRSSSRVESPDAESGIYDGEGAIKWDWVRAIVADHPAEELIFEAPQESAADRAAQGARVRDEPREHRPQFRRALGERAAWAARRHVRQHPAPRGRSGVPRPRNSSTSFSRPTGVWTSPSWSDSRVSHDGRSRAASSRSAAKAWSGKESRSSIPAGGSTASPKPSRPRRLDEPGARSRDRDAELPRAAERIPDLSARRGPGAPSSPRRPAPRSPRARPVGPPRSVRGADNGAGQRAGPRGGVPATPPPRLPPTTLGAGLKAFTSPGDPLAEVIGQSSRTSAGPNASPSRAARPTDVREPRLRAPRRRNSVPPRSGSAKIASRARSATAHPPSVRLEAPASRAVALAAPRDEDRMADLADQAPSAPSGSRPPSTTLPPTPVPTKTTNRSSTPCPAPNATPRPSPRGRR